MRIVILAVGSRGDTQPCVALGAGLRARGHRVRVAASARHARMITDAGLEHAVIRVDPQDIVHSPAGRELVGGGSPLRTIRRFRRIVEPLLAQVVADVDAACNGMEAILATPLGWMGRHASERHGIPYALLRFGPGEPTRAFPHLMLHGRRLGRLHGVGPLVGAGNRLSHQVIEQLTWQLLRAGVNRARGSELGLAPLPLGGPMRGRPPPTASSGCCHRPKPSAWTGRWTR
ncbi:glycosyltransferase, partial [Kitasatospora sp. Root107]|uniref:glycosyltransferase n=1 Tax=Kitasatospora sp. Root107 TaxID=1736424 RepID=UPI000A4B2E9B